MEIEETEEILSGDEEVSGAEEDNEDDEQDADDDDDDEDDEDEHDDEEGQEEGDEAGGEGVDPSSDPGVVVGDVASLGDSDLSFDEGNMLVSDNRPIDTAIVEAPHLPSSEQQLLQIARDAVQALAARLFALPATPHKMGRLVDLPPPATSLPREKPPPRARLSTKWERFAQEKGIQKRKRDKFVYDEGADDWKPRYGYKRINDIKDVPIVEAKASDVAGEDPFTRLAADKKARVRLNAKQQVANMKQAAKAARNNTQSALSQLTVSSASLPLSGRPPPRPSKVAVSHVSALAAGSTASLGKFDRKLEGEKRAKSVGKHRKFLPVVESGGRESAVVRGVVDKLIARNQTDIVDVNKAVKVLKLDDEK